MLLGESNKKNGVSCGIHVEMGLLFPYSTFIQSIYTTANRRDFKLEHGCIELCGNR